MNDLELWERLTNLHEDDDLEGLASSIRALADLSAHARAPFLGFVGVLLEHQVATLRAAGIALLGGSRGQSGIEHIVAGLDDEDADVRAQSVRTLRQTATAAPARWAHASFHPREDVRRLALETEPPRRVESWGAYLRSDPALAELARQAPWPSRATGLVFDMFLQGHVDAREAGEALAKAPTEDLVPLLTHAVRRDPKLVGRHLAAFQDGTPLPDEGRDVLDLWCRIYWACGDDTRRGLADRLAKAVLERRAGLRSRAAFALLLYGQARGHIPALLQLAAACHPPILLSEQLSVEQRRVAALGLWSRDRRPKLGPALVHALLRGPLVGRGPTVDLTTAALLAGFIPNRAIAVLRETAGAEALVRAAVGSPESWTFLAELPVDDDLGPMWLVPRMWTLDPEACAAFIASAAESWLSRSSAAKNDAPKGRSPPATLLDLLLDWIDGAATVRVLCELAGRRAASVEKLAKLTELLLPKLEPLQLVALFEALLPTADVSPAQVVLQRTMHRCTTPALVDTLLRLDDAAREAFCDHAEAFAIPREREIAIAAAFEHLPSGAARRWASGVLTLLRAKASAGPKRHRDARALTDAEADAIAAVHDDQLPSALAPAFEAPSVGLSEALARRPPPTGPSVHACVALLGSRDELRGVARQLDRFGRPDSAFVGSLMPLAVEVWQGSTSVPPLCNAVLHRWEGHGFALLAWLDALPGGLAAALRSASELDEAVPRTLLWDGISRVVLLRRYRQGARLRAWATADVMRVLVENLDTDVGPSAARMLATFHITSFAAEHLERLYERVVMLAADMDADTRRELERWIRIDGLEARATPARRRVSKLGADRLVAVRASSDLRWLVQCCQAPNDALVHEAALRLVELGARGQRALATLLETSPSDIAMQAIATSVTLWDDEDALEQARAIALDPCAPSQHRFRVAVALHQRSETRFTPVALAAVAAPSPSAWLTKADWSLLTELVPDRRTLSTALAGSVHPNAYQRAVKWLLEHGGDDDQSLAALRMFLRAGTHRPAYLRRHAAMRLLEHGDRSGLVVCLRWAFDPEDSVEALLRLAGDEADRLARHALDAALLGGKDFCSEPRCLRIVQGRELGPDVREEATRRLLLRGLDTGVRETLATQVSMGHGRDIKLGQVSEVFAWGVRKGRELTGRLFSVHMTQKREDLGYTRMTENTIHVSPLPLMRGDRHGKDVLEALILHEYGHQLYHRDEESQRIWKRAHAQGIGSVLNLVADEHLERRLRALDATYGDRLKRLAAFAFQHTDRELKFEHLLRMLQASTFAALSTRPLGVAFEDDSVVVDSGLVLRELDHRGHPFARFVRAMRMGLGNRHDDPLLDRALRLFKGGFRHLDMRGLYEIAVELSLMYGSHSDLAETYGGHESLEWDSREGAVHGGGIGDADVQREVERILRPPSKSGGGGRSSGGGSLQINVGADPGFDPITKVVPVAAERERYRPLAVEVRRHAHRLRSYFQEIGLALVPRRARLRGRAFDRTRIRAVVTRRDPRMLVAREREVHTDLFIGVVIDCSGSMGVGRSMDKAHRFGVLLAEAVRGVAGVDARFFGFTDSLIFDAGDENRCGVTHLTPAGGNNDAAALHYAASVALASRRKARLLVMISDGLPTECSVGALRNLVQQLTRREGILCAQVAVRPLEEVCFPDYIELLDPELDRAVRRFGESISRLARRAIGR